MAKFSNIKGGKGGTTIINDSFKNNSNSANKNNTEFSNIRGGKGGTAIINDSFKNNSNSANKNNTYRIAKKSNKQTNLKDNHNSDNWEKAKTIATILAFLTAAIGLITKFMDVW